MCRKMARVLLMVSWASFVCISAGEPPQFEIARTQVVPIQETTTGRHYELYIKLPEKYAEQKDTKFPVLYFTDAKWHLEILSASTEFIMENVILVGISWQKDLNLDLGEHASRFRDYSVKATEKPEHQKKYQFGQAKNHLEFIRNDVFKYVEKHYRVASDNRTYFGYSLGGLFGAYILLSAPQTFQNYILGSPSLLSSASELPKLDKKMLASNGKKANVFISYGTLEKKLGLHIDRFIATLKEELAEHVFLTQMKIEGNHGTAFPMTGVRAVTWLSTLGEGEKE